MQRVVTDFGADDPFARVPGKLKEHYGFSLSPATIRQVTETHARRIRTQEQLITSYPEQAGVALVVAEIDGSMIPVVTPDAAQDDQRKGKTYAWQEVRLSLAHELGAVTPWFGVEFQESVDKAGQILFDCACHAGFGRQTYLHAVGDGAPWIAAQVEERFGTQGHYLVDFYHVCEYLGPAAAVCGGGEHAAWLGQQKALLKRGQAQTVIDALAPHREAPEVADTQAPVRACHRYLSNRLTQLDYAAAQAQGLPIGSGEIESAHRYVIQKRLKLAGTWWSPLHARDMLHLRVMRANGLWESYWRNVSLYG